MIINTNTELNNWKKYVSNILKSNNKLYIKGGNALGLFILKSFIYNYNFDEYYEMFLTFGFIKDWDFYCYGIDDVSSETILEKYNMTLEGKKIKIIRYKTIHERLLVDNFPLIELAIHEKEQLSDMEIPLTCIKIPITSDNLNNIFDTISMFYNNSINKNILVKLFESIDFSQYTPNQYGLFSANSNIFDDGDLSSKFFEIITNYTIDEQQFIISHMKQPDRLFTRLIQKNIPKSNNIIKFCKSIGIDKYNFILDEQFINNIIWKFYGDFKNMVNELFLPFRDKLFDEYCIIDNYNEFGEFLKYYCEDIKNYYSYRNIVLEINNILQCNNLEEAHKVLSVYDDQLINDLMKIKNFKALMNKIHNIKHRVVLYEKFNKNIVINEIKSIMNNNNNNILKENDIINKLYMDIWKVYDELFSRINIGRLTEIIGKDYVVNECVIYIFSDVVRQLRRKYMKCDNEFYNIVIFFMKIEKLVH